MGKGQVPKPRVSDEAILPARPTCRRFVSPTAIKGPDQRRTNDGQPPESEVKGGEAGVPRTVLFRALMADWQDTRKWSDSAPIRQTLKSGWLDCGYRRPARRVHGQGGAFGQSRLPAPTVKPLELLQRVSSHYLTYPPRMPRHTPPAIPGHLLQALPGRRDPTTTPATASPGCGCRTPSAPLPVR